MSTDSGLVLVKEFMESLISPIFLSNRIEDKRLYHIHDNFSLMEQLIYQNIAGYSTDSSANLLKQDPIFKVILDKSQVWFRSLRFPILDRISKKIFLSCKILNLAMIDKVRSARNTTEMIFDLIQPILILTEIKKILITMLIIEPMDVPSVSRI